MANRLAAETSPYLLQHKDNPVEWYPWGEEAFARARAEDKPIFLSVGYSSCHWCHVMEHESFENDGVAAALNEAFVSVKVDREERPDVDETYMTAVQLSSGRGGWPMSVFLTPDKKPFFAGTYFPREDRGGHPGFLTICRQISILWKSKRDEIEENANAFAFGLTESIGQKPPSTFSKFDEEFVANAVRALAADFDPEHGGFGGAPKFPPHTAIDFLLRYSKRDAAPSDLRERALHMARFTLEKMALGGIHDHVGGGFHRYSTDAEWHLPHFEKMLYDNALIAGNCAALAELGFDAPNLLTRQDILLWVQRDMTAPDRSFFSAVDADSEGEEGRFYVWAEAEIEEHLGDRAREFMTAFQVSSTGNFRDESSGRLTGANVLHKMHDAHEDFKPELEKLREVRESRARPGLDSKVLVGWNGLAIASLPAEMAEPAAAAILDAESNFGSLPHQIANGEPSGAAFLEDYAAFAVGLFERAKSRAYVEEGPSKVPFAMQLDGCTASVWRGHAERLTRQMIDLFWDVEAGGFFSTSAAHEELFGRSKPVFDSPTPSGNALALRCLIEIGDIDRAWTMVNAFLGWMERAPQATEALYAAAMELLDSTRSGDIPVPGQAKRDLLEVTAVLIPSEIRVNEHGIGRGEVVVRIPPGQHINSHEPPARWLTPTSVMIQPLDSEVSFPPAPEDQFRGELRIPFVVKLPPNSKGEDFEVTIGYQACTEYECLLPQEVRLDGVVLPMGSH